MAVRNAGDPFHSNNIRLSAFFVFLVIGSLIGADYYWSADVRMRRHQGVVAMRPVGSHCVAG